MKKIEIYRALYPDFKDYTTGSDRRETHKKGLIGEVSASKFLNLYWQGFDFETRKMGDVYGIEVRAIDNPRCHLLVNNRDKLERAFLLADASAFPVVRFTG